MTSEIVYQLLPEATLVLSATLIYLGGAILPARRGWAWLALAALALAAVALFRQAPAAAAEIAGSPVRLDVFSYTLRCGVLAVGVLFVLISARTSEQGESSEYLGSLLLIVAGTMLVALADDLVLLFAALELISIPTYVILLLGRGQSLLESGTKYFFLSLLASALLLYGFSFLYGAAGSTSLGQIHHALASGADNSPASAFAPLALVLIFAALAFRLAAVPFHFYAPDVYQGTTHPNAGLLAVVPKIAGLVVLVRVVYAAMPGLENMGWQVSLSMAMVTMTLGNLLALWQKNTRRLLAYSSIAHAGYMLIGLAVGFAVAGGAAEASGVDGVGAAFFYLLVYSAATAGTFAVLTYLGGPRQSVDTIDDLAGLAGQFPKSAAALAVFMFSLTGLPPLAGFWGKFGLFTAALGVDADAPAGDLWPWFLALAIVGAVNAAISAGYYLRIVGAMYFRSGENRPAGQGGAGAAWAAAACVALVLGIGCFPGPLVESVNRASQAARTTWSAPSDAAQQSPSVQPGDPAVATLGQR